MRSTSVRIPRTAQSLGFKEASVHKHQSETKDEAKDDPMVELKPERSFVAELSQLRKIALVCSGNINSRNTKEISLAPASPSRSVFYTTDTQHI